ncbi:MAG: hypothetical protein GY716_01650 [bacterium]|nr:hypothetical protein [bacterium]
MSHRRNLKRAQIGGVIAFLLVCLAAGSALAQNNECDSPADRPDVIVGDLRGTISYGSVGNIAAFAFGTESCNIGSCWLNWFSGSSGQHPVIGQNMFRFKDGKMEQLGQAWLKHGFFALSDGLCETPENQCIPTNGDHLGVNCSDLYSAGLNGQQSGMGSKVDVDAEQGAHAHPYTGQGQTGNTIYKRLQVHHADLDPTQNPGADYFIEGQYVAADDHQSGSAANNSSWRPINVSPSGGSYSISTSEFTRRMETIHYAWQQEDPAVKIAVIKEPGTLGQFWLGVRATNLGGGDYNYEYLLQNTTSHRSAREFRVPIPSGATVTNIGFHDVDYHSGDPYDSTDWTMYVDTTSNPNAVVWETDTFASNPNANALRWGTAYNFRFDVDAPPASGPLTAVFFRPPTGGGFGDSASTVTTAPQVCDNDGSCEVGETNLNCSADCPGDCGDGTCDAGAGETSCTCESDCGVPATFEFVCDDNIDDDCDGSTDCADPDCCSDPGCTGTDGDADGFGFCEDCDDGNGDAWGTPGEALNLLLVESPTETTLNWDEPTDMGANFTNYEVLRSVDPSDFNGGTNCIADGTPGDLTATELATPIAGDYFCYLVRAKNACPVGGEGSLGVDSNATPRAGVACP